MKFLLFVNVPLRCCELSLAFLVPVAVCYSLELFSLTFLDVFKFCNKALVNVAGFYFILVSVLFTVLSELPIMCASIAKDAVCRNSDRRITPELVLAIHTSI